LVGSDISGVADVTFVRHTLYALIAGAGCSHGLKGTVNSILRVNPNGGTSQFADLSAFLAINQVANPDLADFEPDGTWYSMVRAGHGFYAVEPNHQELDRISGDGTVSRVIDFSKDFPGNTNWKGPTAMVRHGDSLYIGTLAPFPPVGPAAALVFKVDPETGRYTVFASHLKTVVGLAFDREGALYVLETTTASFVPPGAPGPAPAPNAGQIVKISGQHRTTIATGLSFPTAMTFGPDGNLYVSNKGFGPEPGEIVKVAVHAEGEDNDDSDE
jgi:hypothetical protein